MSEKKKFLLRIDAAIYDALEKWAADDLRSVNAQIEFLLSREVKRAGREKHARVRGATVKDPEIGKEKPPDDHPDTE